MTTIDGAPDQLRDSLDKRLQAQLSFPQLRRIASDAANQGHLSVGVDDREIRVSHPADGAIDRPPDPEVVADVLPRVDSLNAVPDMLAVLRNDEVEPAAKIVAGERLLATEAIDLFKRRRQIDPLHRLDVADPQDILAGLAELAQPLLTFEQGGLGSSALHSLPGALGCLFNKRDLLGGPVPRHVHVHDEIGDKLAALDQRDADTRPHVKGGEVCVVGG